MNKLAIFSFYDPQGIVDEYNIHLLKEIKKFYNDIIVVANGALDKTSKSKLQDIANDVLIRENKGFDAWGYKFAFEKLGYENLAKFDEILCFNHTCFGPIFPFDDMFSKMDNKTCDFWGLYFTKAPKGEIYNQGIYIPSYFVAYRKSLVEKLEFKEFWENLPELNSYNDTVKLYEQSQTPFFTNKGFKVEVAFDFSKYEKLSQWWFLEYQAEMLINDKLPLLKRRPFFKDKKGRLNGEFYRKVIPFIKENTNYNIKLIYNNLNRTQNFSEIKKENIFKIFWWKIQTRKEKYQNKLKNIISEKELYQLFDIKQ